MTLHGYALSCGAVSMPYRAYNPNSCTSASAGISCFPAKVVLSCTRNSWAPHQNLIAYSVGIQHLCLSSASSSLLRGELGSLSHTISKLTKRHQSNLIPRVSKDVPYSYRYRYPPMTKRPRWWWRTLACLPYLMPLHETWMYAEIAYHLRPLLKDFEFLTYPFLGSIGRLPSWFLMAYFFVAYLGIIKRKEWPHLFRFHVVMGMLLEIALQVVGTVSHWMPLSVYWDMVGRTRKHNHSTFKIRDEPVEHPPSKSTITPLGRRTRNNLRCSWRCFFGHGIWLHLLKLSESSTLSFVISFIFSSRNFKKFHLITY